MADTRATGVDHPGSTPLIDIVLLLLTPEVHANDSPHAFAMCAVLDGRPDVVEYEGHPVADDSREAGAYLLRTDGRKVAERSVLD